jgi:hypothetical protein
MLIACSDRESRTPSPKAAAPSTRTAPRVIEAARRLASVDDVIAALQGSWSLVSLDGVSLPADAKLTLGIVHHTDPANPRWHTFDCLLDLTNVPSPEDRRPQTLRAPAKLVLAEGPDGEVQLNFGEGFRVVFLRGSNIGSNAFPIRTLGNDTLVVGEMSFRRVAGGGVLRLVNDHAR